MNNLLNMPKIYYINLKKSKDRNEYIIKHFYDYSINNYERIEAEDINDHKNLKFLEGDLPEGICLVEAIVILSHIKALQQFLNHKEEWAIICEDDLDLSTSRMWNFTWNDFFVRLPKNTNIVQLVNSTRTTKQPNFHFHHRTFWDFNTTAYLINKKQAKLIIDQYFNKKLNLNMYQTSKKYDFDNLKTFYQETYPTVEEIIYGIKKENVYSISLFLYNIDFESISNPEHSVQSKIGYEKVLNYWKNQAKYFFIDDIMNI